MVMLLGRGSGPTVERAGFIVQVPRAASVEPDTVRSKISAVVRMQRLCARFREKNSREGL
jgi:hypothetical protein